MNPIVDSLQEHYHEKIQINMDAFEKIKLTQTDMMVIREEYLIHYGTVFSCINF